MNILYHHRTQGRGVEGVHIREIVKAFVSKGHRVEIVSPAGVHPPDAPVGSPLKKAASASFISRNLPEFIFELLEIAYNFVAAKRLRAAAKKTKPAFIFERYAIFNWSGVRVAKELGVPILLEINYTSFTPIYRKRSSILRPLAHAIDRWICKTADGFIAITGFVRDHLIELGVDSRRIIVLPNAADPAVFRPGIPNQALRNSLKIGDARIVGFVGGFFPWHGLDFLVDVFSGLRRDKDRAVLLLIGDGPLKSAIEDKVRGLDLLSSVLFIPYLPHSDLPRYMSLFDIAVMPDSNHYGSPVKIYEYLAMGIPVVAPRLGPIEEGVEHGKEGLLFRRRDAADFSAALERLLSDADERKRMGEAARRKAVAEHTWQRNGDRILELVETLKPKGTA